MCVAACVFVGCGLTVAALWATSSLAHMRAGPACQEPLALAALGAVLAVLQGWSALAMLGDAIGPGRGRAG